MIATSVFTEDPLLHKKVGIILPLTGDVSSFGEDIRNVAIFAKEKSVANQLELIFEDDRCLGKNAVSAARKLFHTDHIDYGMIGCTESMLSVAPLFESQKKLVITPLATAASVSTAGDFIFRTWPSDALAGKLLFDYVKSRHKKFAILSEERSYPQELANSFIEAAKGSELTLFKEDYHSGEIGFKAILLKLKSAGVDGLMVNPNGSGSLLAILKMLRETRINIPLYGVYMPGNTDFLNIAGTQADGIIFVDGPSEKSFSDDGKKLFIEFEERFGPLHSSSFIFGSTFEAIRLLGAVSRQKRDAREFLYNGKFEGIFGPYSFDGNGDLVGPQHQLKIIRNGKAELLE